MTTWDSLEIENKILAVLEAVPVSNDAHPFGRPYVTAYQLAMALHADYPEVAQALDQPVGGAGIGQRNSLAQYLAKRLSDKIRADPVYPVEGAFLSNESVRHLSFNAADGSQLTSSVTDSGYDLSLFRLRHT